MVAAEVVVLHRIVELGIPEDSQPVMDRIRVVVHMEPVRLLADTVEVVVDTVPVAGIVEALKIDMMSAQELELEVDTDWVLRQ